MKYREQRKKKWKKEGKKNKKERKKERKERRREGGNGRRWPETAGGGRKRPESGSSSPSPSILWGASVVHMVKMEFCKKGFRRAKL